MRRFRWLVITAFLTLVMVCLSGCKKTYKLSDYVYYEFDGYDGFGTVEAEFNADKFAKDADVGSYKKNLEKIKIKISPDEELSNGDVITMKVQVPSGLEDKLKVIFTDDTFEVEVDGLEEVDEHDAFKDAEVAFSGYDGLGKAQLTVDDKYFDSGLYTLEAGESLSNGDEVKVILEIPDLDYYIEEYGIVPEAYEKTFTVEGLEEVPSRDYFADITVSFTGMDGEGSVNATLIEGAPMGLWEYSVDQLWDLSNGDTVTISLSMEDEYYFETYGYIPQAKEKTYVVEGLGTYVDSMSSLDSAKITELDDLCQLYVEDLYSKTQWAKSNKHLQKVELIGQYVLKAKEGSYTDPTTSIFMVYALQVEVDDGSGLTTLYWYKNIDNPTLQGEEFSFEDDNSWLSINDDYGYPDRDYVSKVDGEEFVGVATEEMLWELVSEKYGKDYDITSTVDTSKAEYHEGGINKENENAGPRAVSSSEEITSELIETLKTDATTRIKNREAEDMDSGESLNSVEYVETIFVVGGENDKPQNALYVIFKLTATNWNGTFTWYDCFWYTDLTIENGTISVDVSKAQGIGDDHYAHDDDRTYKFYYTGYETLDEIRTFCKSDLGYAVR